jgi:3,4-dihydroxy 2-butanone 4-phosphate synthase / GTP cyclohydrolase II
MTITPTAFATVEEAIDDIRDGRLVVVVDGADRENEGDLTIAAQFATPRRSHSWRNTDAG